MQAVLRLQDIADECGVAVAQITLYMSCVGCSLLYSNLKQLAD